MPLCQYSTHQYVDQYFHTALWEALMLNINYVLWVHVSALPSTYFCPCSVFRTSVCVCKALNVSLCSLRPTLWFSLPPYQSFSVLPPSLSLQFHPPPSLFPNCLPHSLLSLSLVLPVRKKWTIWPLVAAITFSLMNSPSLRLSFHILTSLFSLPAPLFSLEMIISAPGD